MVIFRTGNIIKGAVITFLSIFFLLYRLILTKAIKLSNFTHEHEPHEVYAR